MKVQRARRIEQAPRRTSAFEVDAENPVTTKDTKDTKNTKKTKNTKNTKDSKDTK